MKLESEEVSKFAYDLVIVDECFSVLKQIQSLGKDFVNIM